MVDNYQRGTANEQIWKESPVRPIFVSGAVEGRIRILAGSDSDQYPMLVQAAADGGTDYFLQLTGFDDRSQPVDAQEGIVCSWISAAPGGFTESDIELLV